MNKDWEIKKLCELGNIFSGNSINEKEKKSYMDLSKKGLFYVATKDISTDSEIEYENGILIPDECLSKFKIAHKDSVLICAEGGSAGKKLAYNSEYDICFVNKLFAFESKNSIFPKFVFYYYQSSDFSKHFKNRLAGLIGGVSLQKFKEIQCPVPPLEEQKRIVKILDEKFTQLEKIKTNAQTNLQNAKDLFQSQLTRAFSNTTWEKKRLDEVCAITSKLVDPTLPEYLDLYHVGGANIESETGILLDLKTSKEEGLSSGKFTFDESMVLYNKIRPYLKKVARPDFAGLCSADMYPLNPKNNITKDYLYYILTSDDFTQYAISKSDRAGMPKVNREALFAYKCYLPPLPEQKRIVKELDALSEKVRQLQEIYTKQIANCAELKQSLLQKAFKGEL